MQVLQSPANVCWCFMHICTFGVDMVVGTCSQKSIIQRVFVEDKKPKRTRFLCEIAKSLRKMRRGCRVHVLQSPANAC